MYRNLNETNVTRRIVDELSFIITITYNVIDTNKTNQH
jgi:hypothetical protein